MYKVSRRFRLIGGISYEGDLMVWNMHTRKSIKGNHRMRHETENPFTTHKIKGLEFILKDVKLYLTLTA